MKIMINFDPHTPSCRASYTIIMAKYIFLLSGASCPVTLSGATAHQRQPFLTHFSGISQRKSCPLSWQLNQKHSGGTFNQ